MKKSKNFQFKQEKYYQVDFNEEKIDNKNHSKETIVCLPYDIEQIYSFYCARYKDMSYKEFLQLGYEEFSIKLNSIPESEPLFNIFKARSINLEKIKNKEERKYWQEQKRLNKIPDIYLRPEEIKEKIKQEIKNGGFKNAR